MAKYSTDGPPHPSQHDNTDNTNSSDTAVVKDGTNESTDTTVSTKPDPDTNINTDTDRNADGDTESDTTEISTESFEDVNISGVNPFEKSTTTDKNYGTNGETPKDSFDFSNVDIPGSEDLTESQSPTGTSSTEQQIETDPTEEKTTSDKKTKAENKDIVDTEDTNPLDQSIELAGPTEDSFSDPDASETWGTANNENEFDEEITFQELENRVNNSDDTTGLESDVAEHHDKSETLGESQSNSESLGLEEIEIEGSHDPNEDTTVSTNSPKTSATNFDSGNSNPTDQSRQTRIGTPESVTSTDSQETNTKQRSQTQPKQVDPPSPDPKSEIRPPNGVLMNTIKSTGHGLLMGTQAIIGVTAVIIYGLSIVMEWLATIALIAYSIVLGLVIIFPSATSASAMAGMSGRIPVAMALSIRILPVIFTIFFISMLIDKLLNDGKRYRNDIEFNPM